MKVKKNIPVTLHITRITKHINNTDLDEIMKIEELKKKKNNKKQNNYKIKKKEPEGFGEILEQAIKELEEENV